jgi:signal transduction histidine kinase
MEIEVNDTGIGLSQEQQQKLFKLFGFNKSLDLGNTSGIGLGLVVS